MLNRKYRYTHWNIERRVSLDMIYYFTVHNNHQFSGVAIGELLTHSTTMLQIYSCDKYLLILIFVISENMISVYYLTVLSCILN